MKFDEWECSILENGLNLGKTKVLVSDVGGAKAFSTVGSCGVCDKRVKVNSISCVSLCLRIATVSAYQLVGPGFVSRGRRVDSALNDL